MPGFIWRWSKRIVVSLLVVIVLLLLPSAYIELFCGDDPKRAGYDPIITDAQYQRSEANSYLTYPEWHIVYAYEGLAHVLETGDEHQFDYISSIAGFWSSACSLNRTSQQHGEADFVTRGIIHIIGISFTVELGMKALYEETLGRFFAYARGTAKLPQDEYAAKMARDFSDFLQQTPWFEYDFDTAVDELWALPTTGNLRGWERRLALGGEWKAKSAYASLIGDASDAAGPAILRIRLVVAGLLPSELFQIENVEIIDSTSDYVIIEADRYRKLTITLQEIARLGGEIIEIAGNDDVLVTAIRPQGVSRQNLETGETIADIGRDGYADNRILINARVENLSSLFGELEARGLALEHVYDY